MPVIIIGPPEPPIPTLPDEPPVEPPVDPPTEPKEG